MIKIHFNTKQYAEKLINWQKRHGRNNLPWQASLDPYSVWISEIMLQQTQVKTVIPYYNKFISRFPNIQTLADANEDEILKYWAGLGYYARARNLHKTAKIIAFNLNCVFPNTFENIISLPGIGKSTANAILSICYGQAAPILDGNVKRIFSRLFTINNPNSSKSIENMLWDISNNLMPKTETNVYTQSLMDLGSLICTRTKPNCTMCPINIFCLAYKDGTVNSYPVPKIKKIKPQRSTTFYIYKTSDKILLIKNQPEGIWGGLYSLPEISTLQENMKETKIILKEQRHIFTHFILYFDVMLISVKNQQDIAPQEKLVWVPLNKVDQYPMPTPIRKTFQYYVDHI